MKNKTLLVLGSGQIGEACAIRALKEKPKRIILHTLTESEAKETWTKVRRNNTDPKIKIVPSWGNALVTEELMFTSIDKLHSDQSNKNKLINYYYSYLSAELITKSSLYFLIKKWKPDIIIDGINTATVVGYEEDPYSLPRKIINNDNHKQINATDDLLVSNIIPILIRFVQALRQAMSDFHIDSYIKISTTGLGGMGDNLFYTHGDINEPGMSSGILGKVSASGVIYQLLLSLSHTPGFDIKVIVPAALVGWQGVKFGKFRSHGKNIPLVDSENRIKIPYGQPVHPQKCTKIKKYMEMPYVDSGENCAYSLGEMSAITSIGQMECVTREEVAQAAVESVYGSTRHDLLAVTDQIALGPSHIAAVHRAIILNKLREIEINTKTNSIATNNLGPTVSKHLFELYLIMSNCDYSIEKSIKISANKLTKIIDRYIMKKRNIRSQILSLGLPIIFNSNQVIMSEYYFVPSPTDTNIASEKKINAWASAGWVDLRSDNIRSWQSILKKVNKEITSLGKSNVVSLDRSWDKENENNIGELLGFAYSILGGARKTDFK